MEWVIYFMVALMAFAPSLGLPVLTNSENSGEPAGTIGSGSGQGVHPDSELPHSMDEAAGALGGYPTIR
jgi:hypothetical protein